MDPWAVEEPCHQFCILLDRSSQAGSQAGVSGLPPAVIPAARWHGGNTAEDIYALPCLRRAPEGSFPSLGLLFGDTRWIYSAVAVLMSHHAFRDHDCAYIYPWEALISFAYSFQCSITAVVHIQSYLHFSTSPLHSRVSWQVVGHNDMWTSRWSSGLC